MVACWPLHTVSLSHASGNFVSLPLWGLVFRPSCPCCSHALTPSRLCVFMSSFCLALSESQLSAVAVSFSIHLCFSIFVCVCPSLCDSLTLALLSLSAFISLGLSLPLFLSLSVYIVSLAFVNLFLSGSHFSWYCLSVAHPLSIFSLALCLHVTQVICTVSQSYFLRR